MTNQKMRKNLTEDTTLTGKVLWFSERDGNGIIVVDGEKTELYFDTSVIKYGEKICYRDAVSFKISTKIKHCKCAREVELVK